jgi:hypothetical protein
VGQGRQLAAWKGQIHVSHMNAGTTTAVLEKNSCHVLKYPMGLHSDQGTSFTFTAQATPEWATHMGFQKYPAAQRGSWTRQLPTQKATKTELIS